MKLTDQQAPNSELTDLLLTSCIYADAHADAQERIDRYTRALALAHADAEYNHNMLDATTGMLTLAMEYHGVHRYEVGDALNGSTVVERPRHKHIVAWLWSMWKGTDKTNVRHVAPLPADSGAAGATTRATVLVAVP